MPDQPARGFRPAARDTDPRNPVRRGESQTLRAACFMVSNGAFRKRLQLSTLRVGFDLRIPQLGVEAQEPITENPQLVRRERTYFAFDLFHFAHHEPSFRISLLYLVPINSLMYPFTSSGFS